MAQHDDFLHEATDPEHLIKVADAGHWDGDVFYFEPPIAIAGGSGIMRSLDFAGMQVEPGIGRDDIVSAFLNPVTAVDEDGDHYEQVAQ